VFRSAIENEIADAPDLVSAIKMETLADKQECLLARKKGLSCSRNILVGRVLREYSKAHGRLLPEVVVHADEIERGRYEDHRVRALYCGF